MKQYARLFGICLLFFWAVSPVMAQQNATLIYSGNLDGELEPCGCAENGNFGGIMRRATAVDELRKTIPDLFLISAGGLIVNAAPQDKIKSEYIFKGFAALNYDAIGVQQNDLSLGNQFATDFNLPWTVSNAQLDGITAYRDIKKGQISLRFFHWLSQQELGGHMTPSLQLLDQTPALNQLRQNLQHAKKQNSITLLSTTLTLDEAQKLFPLELIDLLIIKANYEIVGEPQKVGNTIVLHPGSRGMRLGRLDLEINHGKIHHFKHQIIELPKTVEDAPRLSDWYASYNEAVTNLYKQRIAARKNLTEEEKLFAGEAACQSCHPKEHEIWSKSKHAEAFYQLMDVNKDYDPDCVGCHVVGLDRPGGFLDPMLTGDLMHVQCENCHGPAKQHARSQGKSKTTNNSWKPEQMCGQCHIQKHSPDFDFKKYWPNIRHGNP